MMNADEVVPDLPLSCGSGVVTEGGRRSLDPVEIEHGQRQPFTVVVVASLIQTSNQTIR
jgi:hypothetical protein